MRSGYLKYKCKLCGEIYTELFYEDVVDTFWHAFDTRNSEVPILHACGRAQTGLAEVIGYIVCSEGNGW